MLQIQKYIDDCGKSEYVTGSYIDVTEPITLRLFVGCHSHVEYVANPIHRSPYLLDRKGALTHGELKASIGNYYAGCCNGDYE